LNFGLHVKTPDSLAPPAAPSSHSNSPHPSREAQVARLDRLLPPHRRPRPPPDGLCVVL
jgi:hypothetical protein